MFNYCPSVAGCRAVLYGRERSDVNQFFIDEKYTASFYFNESQKGPIYIVSPFSCRIILFWSSSIFIGFSERKYMWQRMLQDSITTVPSHSYSDSLLNPQPIDVSSDYIQACGADNFKNEWVHLLFFWENRELYDFSRWFKWFVLCYI